jgi:ABC-type uncharacterized transport system permease subunit
MATTALRREIEIVSPTRQRVMGVLFIAIGLVIWSVFGSSAPAGELTKFGLNPGGSERIMPDLVLPVSLTIDVLALLSVGFGIGQLALHGGFKKRTNLALGLVSAFFVFAFLTWAAAGKSLNLAGLFNTTLLKAVPLTLGALSGVLCERAGVVNIAIEGMMLMAAMVSALVASVTHNLWIGLLAGVLSAMVLGLVHAVMCIKYKTNQIISGTAINIFATGLTSYISTKFLQVVQDLNNPGTFPSLPIPGLVKIPIIGPILFNNNMFVYAMFIFLVVIQVALFYTRWGLRVR